MGDSNHPNVIMHKIKTRSNFAPYAFNYDGSRNIFSDHKLNIFRDESPSQNEFRSTHDDDAAIRSG